MTIHDMKSEENPMAGPFEAVGQRPNTLLEEDQLKSRVNQSKTETPLTIERIRDIEALEAIREEWNVLFDKTEVKAAELSYLWQTTYWKYFHENAELFVLVIRRSNRIIAIAPLKLSVKRTLGMTTRCIEMIAVSESNYQDLVIGENSNVVLDCVFGYLLELRESWDILSLRKLSEFSDTVPYLLKRRKRTPLQVIIDQEKCVYFQSETSSTHQVASDREMGLASRKLARITRRLAQDLGEVRLLTCQTQEQLKIRLGQFFDLHRRRWNNTEWPSQFNDEKACQFYLDVVPSLFAIQQIELFSLQAGETLLAQDLVFILGRAAVGQLIVYDVNYSKYSPMRILLGLRMNELISAGFEILDYGAYHPYKEQWTNRVKTRFSFEFYSRRIFPLFLYLVARLYETALAKIRNMPFLLKSAKYLRAQAKLFIRQRRYRN